VEKSNIELVKSILELDGPTKPNEYEKSTLQQKHIYDEKMLIFSKN
jgi:hypothetical protein